MAADAGEAIAVSPAKGGLILYTGGIALSSGVGDITSLAKNTHLILVSSFKFPQTFGDLSWNLKFIHDSSHTFILCFFFFSLLFIIPKYCFDSSLSLSFSLGSPR